MTEICSLWYEEKLLLSGEKVRVSLYERTMNVNGELHIKGLTISWDKIYEDSYLRDIPAVSKVCSLSFSSPITFFVGENGSGKSTLLEAMAVAYGFNPEGGTKNYSFSTYDSHSELCDAMTLIRGSHKPGWGYFLRAESFYNVATKEDEYSKEPGGVPLELHQESQFFIVTHSPILLGIPDAQILSFDNGEIHECEYEDTDSYQVTELFINNREQLLKRLLGE